MKKYVTKNKKFNLTLVVSCQGLFLKQLAQKQKKCFWHSLQQNFDVK